MPVLYLMGRSGHGKSSLINVLAGREVAEPSDIKPGTVGASPYVISFSDRFAAWKLIDSRGIFESTAPSGTGTPSGVDAITQVQNDIDRYKPDVIVHVISAPEVRTLSNDLHVLSGIWNSVASSTGGAIPVISVINKVDHLGSRREWPPEEFAKKAGLIHDDLEYMAKDILNVETHPLDLNSPLNGFLVTGHDHYVAIVPTCAEPQDKSNIGTLSDVIGNHLPKSARLDFYQAQQRKQLLRQMSSDITMRFANISAGIGAIPIPFADMTVLVPLQMMLTSIIGGLSCRSFTKDTAYEYLGAAGVDLGMGMGAREIARQIIKAVPMDSTSIWPAHLGITRVEHLP